MKTFFGSIVIGGLISFLVIFLGLQVNDVMKLHYSVGPWKDNQYFACTERTFGTLNTLAICKDPKECQVVCDAARQKNLQCGELHGK